jgi:hypothetical protein
MKKLTPEQAIARLQPQGKARAKGQQQLLALTDVFGRADDDFYHPAIDLAISKPSPP